MSELGKALIEALRYVLEKCNKAKGRPFTKSWVNFKERSVNLFPSKINVTGSTVWGNRIKISKRSYIINMKNCNNPHLFRGNIRRK